MPLTKNCCKIYVTFTTHTWKAINITKKVSNSVIPKLRWAPALFTTLSVVNDKDLILTNLNKEEISWLCSWNVIGTAYRIKGIRAQGCKLGFSSSKTHFLCVSAEPACAWLHSEDNLPVFSLWEEIWPLGAPDSHLPSWATWMGSDTCLPSFINQSKGRTVPAWVIHSPPGLIAVAKKMALYDWLSLDHMLSMEKG